MKIISPFVFDPESARVSFTKFTCPIGPIGLVGIDDHIVDVCFLDDEGQALPAILTQFPSREPIGSSPQLADAVDQLSDYFRGSRKSFELTIGLIGTAFQRTTWQALHEIPYGETASYGSIAKLLNRPKAARAVGTACNRNNIGIIIPCHRVIGADGRLVGYGGGIVRKKYLLALERTPDNSF